MPATEADLGSPDPLDWRQDRACSQTDPEIFFPQAGGSTKDAKKLCLSCPACTECLEDAMSRDERFGVWGGLSERERRRLTKQRQQITDQVSTAA